MNKRSTLKRSNRRVQLTTDDLPFTQEFLAEMLGVTRPSVSLVAHTLQQAGLIRYSRGNIQIVNVDGKGGRLRKLRDDPVPTTEGYWGRKIYPAVQCWVSLHGAEDSNQKRSSFLGSEHWQRVHYYAQA